MERQELRDSVSETTGLSKRKVDDYFAVLAEVIAERLADGEKVELPKLGTLRLQNHQKWIEGRTPPAFLLTPTRAVRDIMQTAGTQEEDKHLPDPRE